jgi:hypothetical protein
MGLLTTDHVRNNIGGAPTLRLSALGTIGNFANLT